MITRYRTSAGTKPAAVGEHSLRCRASPWLVQEGRLQAGHLEIAGGGP